MKKWQVFGLVGVSIFMSTLDSSIVNLALPYIMSDLSTDVKTVQWVVLVYLLTVSSLLLFFGRLSDTRGRGPVYVGGFCIFTAGSLFCGLAGTTGGLIAARGVQGVGASMLMACSPALITDAFEARQRGRALGLVGSVVALGLTLGPIAGGVILEFFSWRMIFYINIPIGIAAIALGAVLLKDVSHSKGSGEPLDRAGSLLVPLMLCGLMMGLTQLSDWGAVSVKSISCLAFFLFCLGGFIRVESKSPHPLFDLELLKIRSFTLPLLATLNLFACLFLMVFMLPFFLTYPCGFSAARTGSIMIVPFLFLLLVSPLSGALADRLGSRTLCTAGMVLMCLSLLALQWARPGDGVMSLLLRIAPAGVGTALFISPNNTAIMGAVPANRRGIASGAVATARNLGMVFGVALAGTLFSASFSLEGRDGAHGLAAYTPAAAPAFMAGFRQVMTAGSVLAAVGILVAFVRGNDAY